MTSRPVTAMTTSNARPPTAAETDDLRTLIRYILEPTITLQRRTLPAIDAARLQLTDWTAEHRPQTLLAAPSTTRSNVTTIEGDHIHDDNPIHAVDRTRQDLEQLDTDYATLVTIAYLVCGTIGRTDPLLFPTAAHALRHAFCGNTPALPPEAFRRAYKASQSVARIIGRTKPGTTEKGGETCQSHTAAGTPNEPVAPEYRHWCQWCGRFRATHGVHPPAVLVRLHDRGIRIGASHLRRAGVKVAS